MRTLIYGANRTWIARPIAGAGVSRPARQAPGALGAVPALLPGARGSGTSGSPISRPASHRSRAGRGTVTSCRATLSVCRPGLGDVPVEARRSPPTRCTAQRTGSVPRRNHTPSWQTSCPSTPDGRQPPGHCGSDAADSWRDPQNMAPQSRHPRARCASEIISVRLSVISGSSVPASSAPAATTSPAADARHSPT
jgi:hypothetical protein